MKYIIKLVFALSISIHSTEVLAQEKKPYDRTKWFDSNSLTTDDLRRIPQSKGYGDHEDKIVIVTGSTQGSGAETAKLFAYRGAKGITICGRKEKEGNNIKEEIEKIGSECIFVKADLFEEKDCRNIIESTDKAFGKVHNNPIWSTIALLERMILSL